MTQPNLIDFSILTLSSIICSLPTTSLSSLEGDHSYGQGARLSLIASKYDILKAVRTCQDEAVGTQINSFQDFSSTFPLSAMINLGLTRITKLLARTSIPWKAVHIAGTNGKGSVASIIASLLHVSGISVGRFNSPHLIDRWDCITINQQAVLKSVFLETEKLVKNRNAAEKIDASEFEILTAIAFEIFTNAKVQVGVVECGLGGRLDATNFLKPEQVLCSVITKVGIDHEALLGDTVAKIATEKVGILKKGRPFVFDPSNQVEVLKVFCEAAEQSGAVQTSIFLRLNTQQQLFENTLQWPVHQQENLITALLACLVIEGEFVNGQSINVYNASGGLGPDQLAAVMASPTAWPGRLQLIDTSRITGNASHMLLDGAHNQQAAQALGKHVDQICRPRGPIVWVIAMSKGKNVKDFAEALFKPADRVIATQFGPVDGMPWIQSEGEDVLMRSTRDTLRIRAHFYPNPWDALRKASEIAEGTPVVICGSLYLVGDVLRLLRDPPEELGGPKWDAWVEMQKRKLQLRKKRVFE